MTRVCEGCDQPYGRPHHGQRYCSVACHRAAPRPENLARLKVIPTPEAVVAEMSAAYDALLGHELEEAGG